MNWTIQLGFPNPLRRRHTETAREKPVIAGTKNVDLEIGSVALPLISTNAQTRLRNGKPAIPIIKFRITEIWSIEPKVTLGSFFTKTMQAKNVSKETTAIGITL